MVSVSTPHSCRTTWVKKSLPGMESGRRSTPLGMRAHRATHRVMPPNRGRHSRQNSCRGWVNRSQNKVAGTHTNQAK